MAYTDGLKIGYAGIMVSITKQYEIWGLPIWDLTPRKSVNFMAMALMILEGFGHFDDGTCILNESLSINPCGNLRFMIIDQVDDFRTFSDMRIMKNLGLCISIISTSTVRNYPQKKKHTSDSSSDFSGPSR